MQVQRICEYCGNEFIAQKTVTRYCSHRCNQRHYKQRHRQSKIGASNSATQKQRTTSIETIKAKEFLTVPEVAHLLSLSTRSVYNYIESGKIQATNIGERLTRVKRSEIDKLFRPSTDQLHDYEFSPNECYTMTEVQTKFNISEKAAYDIVKRNGLPKVRRGKYTLIPKSLINEIFMK